MVNNVHICVCGATTEYVHKKYVVYVMCHYSLVYIGTLAPHEYYSTTDNLERPVVVNVVSL